MRVTLLHVAQFPTYFGEAKLVSDGQDLNSERWISWKRVNPQSAINEKEIKKDSKQDQQSRWRQSLSV
jgi:hypothetical protein